MERAGVTSLIGAVALWLAMVSPALSDDTFKVAVMNQQVVVEQSKAGKRALEELKAYSMSRQKIINADDLELKELQQATQDEKLSDSAKQEKQSQFQTKLDAYQRRLSDFNREIQQKQRDMVAEYSKKVQAAAQAVGEKTGYVAIIDKGVEAAMKIVLYHQPALDLTERKRGQPGWPLCSRNAHDKNVLVRRAQ
jgi:outer membrane protein